LHNTIKSLLAVLALSATATASFSADIRLPDPNYPGGRATVHAIKAIAEEVLGLEVETVTTTAVPVIWQSMHRGKGEIDIWPEVWLPNQQGLVDKYVKGEKSVRLTGPSYGAIQGYCVTKAASEKHGITSVFDLGDPDKAALFDSNGDGKGEIWIGPAGWQSTNIEKVRARDYGFAEFFELQSLDEAVATASLDKAAKAGKPWIGYCYGPHQNFALYELVILKEPKHDPAKFKMVQPNADPAWFDKSSVSSAYADTSVHIAYSTDLAERPPALAKLLENVKFDSDLVSKWSYEIAVNKREPADVATEWVKANMDMVTGWVK